MVEEQKEIWKREGGRKRERNRSFLPHYLSKTGEFDDDGDADNDDNWEFPTKDWWRNRIAGKLKTVVRREAPLSNDHQASAIVESKPMINFVDQRMM